MVRENGRAILSATHDPNLSRRDDCVPVALLRASNLNRARAPSVRRNCERRTIRSRRRRRLRAPVGGVEEAAFAQARADRGEVITSHDARERDWSVAHVGLPREKIKRRLVVDRQGMREIAAALTTPGMARSVSSSVPTNATRRSKIDSGRAESQKSGVVCCGSEDSAAADVETSAAAITGRSRTTASASRRRSANAGTVAAASGAAARRRAAILQRAPRPAMRQAPVQTSLPADGRLPQR